MATTDKNRKLSVNTQHDYLTLKTPVGSFTVSRNGSKASGQLAAMKGAFTALDRYVETERKKEKITLADIFKELSKPEVMDKLVPGWDNPLVSDIKEGDTAKFTEPLFIKHYPAEYEVVAVKKTTATIRVPDSKSQTGFSRLNVPMHCLTKVAK